MRVLILDDNAPLLVALSAMLKHEGSVQSVHVASTAGQAEALAAQNTIDVFVVDEDLGNDVPTGTDFIEAKRATNPDAKFLLLTGHRRWDVAARALQRGADGFLLKGSMPRRMVEAIRMVAAGDCYLDAEMVSQMIMSLREERAKGAVQCQVCLTEAEMDVLDGVARGEGNAEIARRRGTTLATVKSQVKAICAKFGVHGRERAVSAARKQGLL